MLSPTVHYVASALGVVEHMEGADALCAPLALRLHLPCAMQCDKNLLPPVDAKGDLCI